MLRRMDGEPTPPDGPTGGQQPPAGPESTPPPPVPPPAPESTGGSPPTPLPPPPPPPLPGGYPGGYPGGFSAGQIPSAPGAQPSRGPVPMRPLKVGETLDGALRLYRARFATLLAITAIILGPVALAQIVGTQMVVSSVQNAIFASQADVESALRSIVFIGVGAGLLYFLVVNPLLTATSIRVIAGTYLGERVTVGQALGFGFRRILPVLWVIFLTSLPFAGIVLVMVLAIGTMGPAAFILIIVALPLMIWLYILFLFAPAVVVVENTRGIAAVKRSIALAKGNKDGGRIFGAVLLAGIIVWVLGAVATSLANAVTQSSIEATFLVQTIVDAGFQILTTPFTIGVIVVLYFDQRIRREAMDLAIMAQEIGLQNG